MVDAGTVSQAGAQPQYRDVGFQPSDEVKAHHKPRPAALPPVHISQSAAAAASGKTYNLSASEVTTLWRYTNLLLLFFLPQIVKIPGVKN